MFKKVILILFLLLIPKTINASSNSLAKIGNNYYDSLVDAINVAGPNDTIVLTSNVSLEDTLEINKTVNINLNGKTIAVPEKVFLVQGGTLNLTGKGTIKEDNPYYGAIVVKGSTDSSKNNYSTLKVGKNVTLEGWSGIFIDHNNFNSYGVNINLEGTINAVNDREGGSGVGIYVNGNIKQGTNEPIINIQDNAQITSTGNGIYIAGNSTFNIKKATIKGIEAGIGIKSGTLNIDGATIIGTGEDKTPTEGYNNGIKPSGTSIQIESNNGYNGNINLNIKQGNLKSIHSNVIYEYIGKGTNTTVNYINISGGKFISEASKNVFRLSESFTDKHSKFIVGGTFSSNPNNYLKPGYITTLDNDLYTVIKSTMKEVNIYNKNKKSSNIWIYIISSLIIIPLIVFAYINRNKIINFIKK